MRKQFRLRSAHARRRPLGQAVGSFSLRREPLRWAGKRASEIASEIMRPRVFRLLSDGLLPALIVLATSNAYEIVNRDSLFIPYVPSPEFVVDRMLELGEIGKDDLVLDMGSGDGRIVITAAQRYGARGRGVEIDPELVAEARENARKAGVADRTAFVAEDMFKTEIADATVMTLYVLTASNLELRPRILREMQPGSRIVSHQFSMGAWLADKHESYGDIQIYMWYVPASVAGTWAVTDGKDRYRITFTQYFQEIEGSAENGARSVSLRQARLRGTEIDFAINWGDENPRLFRGRVDGDRIVPRGAPSDSGREWNAVRITAPFPLAQ